MRVAKFGLFLMLLPVVCAADEKDGAAPLSSALGEVRAALPPAWDAKIAIYRRDRIAIIVHTREPIQCRQVIFNASPDDPNRPVSIIFEMALVVRPHLTTDNYAEIRKQNTERNHRREEFIRTNLKNVRWGFMGPQPIPPSAFSPKNDSEIERVNQYALLWTDTEPVELPTHYRGAMSFTFDFPFFTIMEDGTRAAEQRAIVKKLNEIFTSYETPRAQ